MLLTTAALLGRRLSHRGEKVNIDSPAESGLNIAEVAFISATCRQ